FSFFVNKTTSLLVGVRNQLSFEVVVRRNHLNPSNPLPILSSLSHLNLPHHQPRHVSILPFHNPLLRHLVHVVRVPLINSRWDRVQLILRHVIRPLPRVLAAVAGLRRRLPDPSPVSRVALEALHAFVDELLLDVLDCVDVVGVELRLLLSLSTLLVVAHRSDRHRVFLGVDGLHFCFLHSTCSSFCNGGDPSLCVCYIRYDIGTERERERERE
ncbi:unnamed protein product, partial [Prunus brigantina]